MLGSFLDGSRLCDQSCNVVSLILIFNQLKKLVSAAPRGVKCRTHIFHIN